VPANQPVESRMSNDACTLERERQPLSPQVTARETTRERLPKGRSRKGNSKNYLYVALVRASSSRWALKSTIDPNAGPPSGLAFMVSRSAALTLSRPLASAVM